MNMNQLKDALEELGEEWVEERRLPHGRQLRLRSKRIVNLYHTGAMQVQGPKWTALAAQLARLGPIMEARTIERARMRGEKLFKLNVSTVQRFLEGCGYASRNCGRLLDNKGCKICVEGGPLITVYDCGTFVVQGKHFETVRTLLENAAPSEGRRRVQAS